MTGFPAWYWFALLAGGFFAVVFLRPRNHFGEARYTGLTGGEPGEIEAWGLDGDLEPVSHGFPNLEEARTSLRAAHAASAARYDNGEDALSATVRGFSRSGDEGDFVEIHCLYPDRAQARVGVTVTSTQREQSAPCNGAIALDRLVEAYFGGPERFARHWYSLAERTERYRHGERPAPADRPS